MRQLLLLLLLLALRLRVRLCTVVVRIKHHVSFRDVDVWRHTGSGIARDTFTRTLTTTTCAGLTLS